VFFKDIRLPLLLRTALDDSNATVVSSAVECLHALLVDPREEELYEVLWTTLRGVEAFPLLPDSTLPYARAECRGSCVRAARARVRVVGCVSV
jgi:hypothetical protein